MSNEEEEKSLAQELWEILIEKWHAVWRWYLPKPEHSIAANILMAIVKFPVILLLILLSPIAFCILLFTFIVVL